MGFFRLIVNLSLAVILTAAFCGCAVKPGLEAVKAHSPLHEAAEQALERAIPAMLQQKRLDAGNVWNLQQLLGMRPDDELSAFLDRAVKQLEGSDYERLVNPDAARFQLPDEPGSGGGRLANYLKATAGEPEERAVEWIAEFLAQPSYGYLLTHQLLAIRWAESTGLALPQSLLDLQPLLLERIAAEHAKATTYSDIYTERVALILMYGSPTAADAAGWIETIVNQQLENGMWDSRPASAGGSGNKHPTSWCMFALAIFLEDY